MKATPFQLKFIENFEKNFRVQLIDWGFYSDGSIGINFKDQFGEHVDTVYPNQVTKK
jgi:hypothetical protein